MNIDRKLFIRILKYAINALQGEEKSPNIDLSHIADKDRKYVDLQLLHTFLKIAKDKDSDIKVE